MRYPTNKTLLREISEIKAVRSKECPPEGHHYAFAAPVLLQTIEPDETDIHLAMEGTIICLRQALRRGNCRPIQWVHLLPLGRLCGFPAIPPLHPVPYPSHTVRCAPGEAALFNPPPGQICGQYAGNFSKNAGHGYLTYPSATRACGYCEYTSGVEYLVTLNIRQDQKWRVRFNYCSHLVDKRRPTDCH